MRFNNLVRTYKRYNRASDFQQGKHDKKNQSSVISEIKKILNKKKKYELKKNSFKEIDYRFENISNKPSYKNIVKFWNNLKNNKYCKVNNEFLIKHF